MALFLCASDGARQSRMKVPDPPWQWKYLFHRGVAKADFDILTVISEGFSENRKPADVLGIVLHGEAETDVTAAVEMEIIDFDVRYFKPVDIGTFLIDDKLF